MTEVKCIKGNIKEQWVIKGTSILHRDDGPVIIYYYENGNKFYELWYQNDKLHREDGPAILNYNRNGSLYDWEYWINHKDITKWVEENFNNPLEPTDEEIVLLRLTWC